MNIEISTPLLALVAPSKTPQGASQCHRSVSSATELSF
jgi:hypothetical protein